MPRPDPTPDSCPRILALTGAIGSGKSTVRRLFQDLGVPCLDADFVARQLHQNARHPVMTEIAASMPVAVCADGTLERGSLRTLFAIDPAANAKLKRLLKPYLIAEALRWTRAQSASYVVWESALIIDQGIACDRVLVIDAAAATRHARITARNPDWSSEQIRQVNAIQLSRTDYLAHADDVIGNDGSDTALALQVAQLHRMYLKKWS